MTIPTVEDVRRFIAAGAPHDHCDMKRLVQRATSRVANVSLAERLRGRLADELSYLVLARKLGTPEQVTLAMADVERRLTDIEELSWLA